MNIAENLVEKSVDKPIRPAATILIVRDREVGIEVLTLKRSASMRFLPGFLAFPGGSVSPDDERIAKEQSFGQIVNQEQSNDLVYAVAAVRETAEEIGWICPVERDGEIADMSISAGRQELLLAGAREAFTDFLAEQRLKINFGRLRFVGRWVTPEYMPARFDTRFFLYLVQQTNDLELTIHGGEHEWGRWEAPQALLARIQTKQEQAVPPTIAMLKALANVANVNEAWETLKVPGPKPEDL